MHWNLVTPIVYRMLPREWVDRFFESGELRLSSFREFVRHPDEERHDIEGVSRVFLRGKRNTLLAEIGVGMDAYVLCASAVPPTDEMLKAFGSDAAIEIFQTVPFAAAISRYLSKASWGYEGYCQYHYDTGDVQVLLDDELIEKLRDPMRLDEIRRYVVRAAGPRVFFRKPARFSHQFEYRLVWGIPNQTVDNPLLITAPDARKYCRPWYPESRGSTTSLDRPNVSRSPWLSVKSIEAQQAESMRESGPLEVVPGGFDLSPAAIGGEDEG